MLLIGISAEIKTKYQSGERSFQNLQLRNCDLRGIDLSQADLSGTDLTGANLRDANLSGSNLQNAYFNEADLTGANLAGACLQGASLIKAYLNKANLSEANLQKALMTNAYATKANLSYANLKGTFLNGTKLSGAILIGVEWDDETRGDANFGRQKNEVGKAESPANDLPFPAIPAQSETAFKVADLLITFNHFSNLSRHYLGGTMTLRYWQSTRPDFPWLQQFQVDRASSSISYDGDRDEELTALQLQWAREWAKGFAKTCSQIVQDFPNMIDRSQVIFSFSPSHSNPTASAHSSRRDSSPTAADPSGSLVA